MSTAQRHVFVSYCRTDAAWLDRLRVHLRPLVQQEGLDVWDDSRIEPGQVWREEIETALARAQIAVLLMSADFLASDFITNNELPSLLHGAAHRGLLILPLIVGPSLFAEHPALSRYQTVNRPDRPLSGMSRTEAEAVLVSLGRSIQKYCRLTARRSVAQNGVETPTPAAARDPLAVERPLNLGFDGPVVEEVPLGWFNSFGHVSGVSTDYVIRTTQRSRERTAGTCVVLEKINAAPAEFGSLMQRCPGQHLAGRTVRIEADLRTHNVSGWAGLWLRADAQDEPNLFFDNMSRRPLEGTTEWARYSIDAPLPLRTAWLNYGVVLAGAGTVYADDIRFLVWNAGGEWQDV